MVINVGDIVWTKEGEITVQGDVREVLRNGHLTVRVDGMDEDWERSIVTRVAVPK